MANVTKGHVKIDGQEYLIDERSYQVSESPDLAPQIQSGTPGYQDHIIFKNDAQSIWGGGYDFDYTDDFTNPTTFKSSSNIDVFRKTGEFTLSRRLDNPSLILLQSGSQYVTNTKDGFDMGVFTNTISTTTPDIRLDVTEALSTKETFDGGGLAAEFTQSGTGTFSETGGFGRITVTNGQSLKITGGSTDIKGWKVVSPSRSGWSGSSNDFHFALTDTNFTGFAGRTGNYIIFRWLSDVAEIEIWTGGSSYGSNYSRFADAGSDFEIQEESGSIKVYYGSTLKHTISTTVATGSFFLWYATHSHPTESFYVQCDTIQYHEPVEVTSGSWKSSQYTNTGSATDSISSLIVKFNGLTAKAYIDSIQILDASDDSVLSTRAANITSGASLNTTGLSTQGWSTQWSNAALDDKDVKVNISLATSAGTGLTPKVSEVRLNFTSSATATQAVDGLIAFSSDLYTWGSKQLWKTTNGTTWTNQATATSAINDAEAFEGRLFLAEGAYGYQFTATGAALTGRTGASGFTADYFAANTSGASGRLYAVDDNKLAYSNNPEAAVPTWTTAFIHAGSTGEDYFLGKPEVHNRFVYYSVNRGDTTNGPGSIYLYDHNNGTSLLVAKEEMPISKKIKSFAGRLYYAVLNKTALIVKAIDGGSVRQVKRIELSDATFQDPIEWLELDGKLNMIAESSSASAYQYEYDPSFDQGGGEGWVRKRTLSSSNTSGEYVMGVLDREMYIGNDDGEIRKVSTSYNSSGSLDSSAFDAGQFKIKKKYVEIEVHHDPLPSNTTVSLAIKLDNDTSWTTIGSNAEVNSSQFTVPVPSSNNVGRKLFYQITPTTSDGTSSPAIKDVIIRYQFIEPYRRQWQFGVIVTDSIEYLDGSREQKDAAGLLQELQDARRNTETGTIDFYDIDDSLHSVDYMRIGVEVPRVVGSESAQDYLVGVQMIETDTDA